MNIIGKVIISFFHATKRHGVMTNSSLLGWSTQKTLKVHMTAEAALTSFRMWFDSLELDLEIV